ncbi:MAG: Crp/Fnr family transcriptional regulator [Deltaproteobacteria bacterium]|nr:Crp/Fnr family transcriptional regulator [Deltaproteobacteria bacterium]
MGTLEHLCREHPEGDLLFEEGDVGKKMFVIQSGQVQIFRTVGKDRIVLAHLGPGEFFGEMAILEGLPRSASALVVEPTKLIEVDSRMFEEMISENAEIAIRIMRKLAGRVRELDLRLQNLLSEGGVGRAIEVLRQMAAKGSPESGGRVRLAASAVHIAITAQCNLSPAEVEPVLEQLRRSGCIRTEGIEIVVADEVHLERFAVYLDLKRKFEPAQSELSDTARRRMDRLIRALELEEDDLHFNRTVLAEQYQRYLDLKGDFEALPAAGPGTPSDAP